MEEEDDNDNNNDNEDSENNEVDEDDKNNEDDKDEDFCLAKMLKITKYTSLPNLVRLALWELVSALQDPYFWLLNICTAPTSTSTTGEFKDGWTSSPTQLG